VAEHKFQNAVTEISPWVSEKRFSGSVVWWDYVLSKSERQRLESLIGMALLDAAICKRLIQEHDESLFEAFGLSAETREWLKLLHANSLIELAEAITTAVDVPTKLGQYPEAA